MARARDRSILITFLRLISKLIPGNYLKTFIYLNVIAKPRKVIQLIINSFYRMDHIYEVLRECKKSYVGNFTILEFGTAQGYSFTKMLYATKYLGMDDRVVVHTFDSFEGLPATIDTAEQRHWKQGAFKGDYEILDAHCRARYSNYKIHKGMFDDTLTESLLAEFKNRPPILVWIDCDYYGPARLVMGRLIPYLPTGCVIYFDDVDVEFRSRLTGEMKLIHEINHGLFGDDIELVLDVNLSNGSGRLYRFINRQYNLHYERNTNRYWGAGIPRSLSDDSPMP